MSWIISDLEIFSISLEIGWASWQGPTEKRLLVRPFYKQTLFFTDWQIIINPSVKAQRAIKRKRWESLNVVCRAASGKERHLELRRDSGVCVSLCFLRPVRHISLSGPERMTDDSSCFLTADGERWHGDQWGPWSNNNISVAAKTRRKTKKKIDDNGRRVKNATEDWTSKEATSPATNYT